MNIPHTGAREAGALVSLEYATLTIGAAVAAIGFVVLIAGHVPDIASGWLVTASDSAEAAYQDVSDNFCNAAVALNNSNNQAPSSDLVLLTPDQHMMSCGPAASQTDWTAVNQSN